MTPLSAPMSRLVLAGGIVEQLEDAAELGLLEHRFSEQRHGPFRFGGGHRRARMRSGRHGGDGDRKAQMPRHEHASRQPARKNHPDATP